MHKAGWNVATSQRRDVGSTKNEVNKRQRCDVSASSASPSLKVNRGQELKGRIVRSRARKSKQQQSRSRRRDLLLYFLLF